MAVKGNIPDIGKPLILKLQKDIAQETEDRKAGDSELQKDLAQETEDRKAGDSELQKALEAETEAREKGDSDILKRFPVQTKDIADGAVTAEKLAPGVIPDVEGYTHPTDPGWKHIPTGGSSGQILTWKANGEAQWGAAPAGGETTPVDATLTKSGEAADAKVVGDRLGAIEGRVTKLENGSGGGSGGGSGDVVGPSSAVGGHVAVFDGATGKLIKDGGHVLEADVTAADVSSWNGAVKEASEAKSTAENAQSEVTKLREAFESEYVLRDRQTGTVGGLIDLSNGPQTFGTTVKDIGTEGVSSAEMFPIANVWEENSLEGNPKAVLTASAGIIYDPTSSTGYSLRAVIGIVPIEKTGTLSLHYETALLIKKSKAKY